jgi:hypothetical protein
VWGYLVPLDTRSGDVLVLHRRSACPVPSSKVGNTSGKETVAKNKFTTQEEGYEQEKVEHGITSGGYLIGRHPECGKCSLQHFESYSDTVQTGNCSHRPYRTDIVCCFPRTRAAMRLQSWRICPATAHSSTIR